MDELGHDERMRRLQRIAYGAVASDAERAAAVVELEALRREREREREQPGSDAAAPEDAASPPGATAPRRGAAESASGSRPASDTPAPSRYRWAIAVGTAALVVGIAVGWQLGLRMHELTGEHPVYVGSPDVELAVGAMMPLPIEAAPATEVFDREPAPSDAPIGLDREDLLHESYRLLSTRSDSVRIYAARTIDAANVCIVITLPTVETPSDGVVPGGSGSACTHDGRFPGEGMTIGFSGQGRSAIRATWNVDGSVSVSPADSPAPAEPNATG